MYNNTLSDIGPNDNYGFSYSHGTYKIVCKVNAKIVHQFNDP